MSALTIPFQYADSLPLVHDEGTVAYIIEISTGEVYDEAGNFESAQSYVQSGDYVAVVVADELHPCVLPQCWYCETYGPVVRAKADMQASLDNERRLYEDCFNVQAVA